MIDDYMPTTSTQDKPYLFDCDNKCCGCDNCGGYEDGFQYLILEDAGVTKAELKRTDIDAFNVLIKLFSTLSTKYVAFEDTKFHEPVIMKPSYKGAARVNFKDGDTFNEDDGIKLSREKALYKYHRDFDRIIAGALKDARILCANLERYCDKNHIDISNVPSVQEIRETRYKKI